jgi:site-specific DNA-methyltransferase (adenine-specific)
MISTVIGKATLYNADCMEYMATLPDKAFELAIVDPPYGIGESGGKCRTRLKHNNFVKHEAKNWDDAAPNGDYFIELMRVSRNQIIWGANYFPQLLSSSMGWIFWDKLMGGDFSDGELAFTSFDRALKKVVCWAGYNGTARIHPTQKPVKLYEWLLTNYAKPGQRILDTHLGSMSSVIACNNLGFEMVGIELDEDYFKAGCERATNALRQVRMFD